MVACARNNKEKKGNVKRVGREFASLQKESALRRDFFFIFMVRS